MSEFPPAPQASDDAARYAGREGYRQHIARPVRGAGAMQLHRGHAIADLERQPGAHVKANVFGHLADAFW